MVPSNVAGRRAGLLRSKGTLPGSLAIRKVLVGSELMRLRGTWYSVLDGPSNGIARKVRRRLSGTFRPVSIAPANVSVTSARTLRPLGTLSFVFSGSLKVFAY